MLGTLPGDTHRERRWPVGLGLAPFVAGRFFRLQTQQKLAMRDQRPFPDEHPPGTQTGTARDKSTSWCQTPGSRGRGGRRRAGQGAGSTGRTPAPGLPTENLHALGRGAPYPVVQRAEVLEASEAGIDQADQDGEQDGQEGEQSEGGLQTWGHSDASLSGGRGATSGAGAVRDLCLGQKGKKRASAPRPPAAGVVSSSLGQTEGPTGLAPGWIAGTGTPSRWPVPTVSPLQAPASWARRDGSSPTWLGHGHVPSAFFFSPRVSVFPSPPPPPKEQSGPLARPLWFSPCGAHRGTAF